MKWWVHQRLGLVLSIYLYKSTHRNSSAETSLSAPKYVSICMIRSDWFTHSPLDFFFAITLSKVQAVMKIHSGIIDFSIIWLHTGLQEPEEPTVMKTDSGVDGGNYWTVYIVLPNLHLPKLLASSFFNYLYTTPWRFVLHLACNGILIKVSLLLFYETNHRSSSA